MRKIAVGIITALVGGAMLVSGAGAASAATKTSTELKIRDITPNPVVVNAGGETKAYFDIGASSDVAKVTLSVAPESDVRTFAAKSVQDLQNWRFSVAFTDGDFAGKWKATAVAFDKDNKQLATDSAFFNVDVRKGKADTRITRFNAEPYKVRKGRTISFTGRLQVDDEGWEGVRGEKVSIFYRANGSSGWKWVASAKTRWSGKFYAETRAYKSGTFKAVYGGNDELNGSESRTDYVKVYRHWYRR